MNFPTNEDSSLPEYPPLPVCSLVDSRFSSRKKLVQDLEKLALFDKVREAESFRDGLSALHEENVDSCLIGPSVSVSRVRNFFLRAKKIPRASSCAFLVVRKDDSCSEEELESIGAHAVLKHPYSKQQLGEKIVTAVVKANPDTIWTKLRGEASSYQHQAQVSAAPEVHSAKSAEQGSEGPSISRLVVTSVFKATVGRLKDIAVGHQKGIYSLKMDGTPTRETMEAIEQLIGGIIKSHHLPSEQKERLSQFLHRSIRRWFYDMTLESEKTATDKLRKELISFAARGG